MQKWQCRWSPTLGPLEDTHQTIWGTDDYTDDQRPTVFFGLYGLPDFYALWRHKGEKHILWAGTDIQHFIHGYWLDIEGKIRIRSGALAEWINTYCKNYVENGREQEVLKQYGIESVIIPSFLGDINKFPISEKRSDKKRYYASVSGDNFEQYGWDKIGALAIANPLNEYHLYGNKNIYVYPGGWPNNVIIHGRVPKEQMNEEIKSMTGCIRLLNFDGFSEVVAKAILMGQEVISTIPYNYTRESLLKVLNKYPWVT